VTETEFEKALDLLDAQDASEGEKTE